MIYIFIVLPLYIGMLVSISVVVLAIYSVANLVLKILLSQTKINAKVRYFFSLIIALAVYWFSFDIKVVGVNAVEGWALEGIDLKMFGVALAAICAAVICNSVYGRHVANKAKG